MASKTSESHPQERQPRMTAYRYIIRLCDRLELLLLRYVDHDPVAKGDFAVYKVDRNRKWAERDEKRSGGTTSKSDLKVVAAATPSLGGRNGIFPTEPRATTEPLAGPTLEHLRRNGKGKETEVFPGFDFQLGEQALAARTASGDELSPQVSDDDNESGIEQQHTNQSRPRTVSKSSTFSSVVESTRSEARRRKRKRSDARPGYFDPETFPRDGNDSEMAVAAVREGDKLVMNIPVELGQRKRR